MTTDQLNCEPLPGPTLHEFMKHVEAVSPTLALMIAIQICTGLIELANANLAHCFINPHNIKIFNILSGKPQVKVTNFGFVHSLNETNLSVLSYVAPEVFSSPNQWRSSSDVYSLGCLMCFLIEGRHPFDGNEPLLEQKFSLKRGLSLKNSDYFLYPIRDLIQVQSQFTVS
eukprot:TRINITY_DN3173_c0_g2_i1.p2 TRINITY_DN3173_c0_g2~~TRINITY_DN3173_c0_g2_i1.p2  ORF type:complete len:171 (-),score=24.63 TRINITY_DN3173_c0_g2_i1:940-1452(-)